LVDGDEVSFYKKSTIYNTRASRAWYYARYRKIKNGMGLGVLV
jgi:hypothetical protein